MKHDLCNITSPFYVAAILFCKKYLFRLIRVYECSLPMNSKMLYQSKLHVLSIQFYSTWQISAFSVGVELGCLCAVLVNTVDQRRKIIVSWTHSFLLSVCFFRDCCEFSKSKHRLHPLWLPNLCYFHWHHGNYCDCNCCCSGACSWYSNIQDTLEILQRIFRLKLKYDAIWQWLTWKKIIGQYLALLVCLLTKFSISGCY